MRWWIRPLVRAIAAICLPLLVPAVITGILWALPGNPVDIICPPELCTGGAELAAKWNLDRGPVHFYTSWVGDALLRFDLGRSWRAYQGMQVKDLMGEAVPWSGALILAAMLPILLGSLLTAMRVVPRWADSALQGLGLVPAVILALLFAAVVEISFGPFDDSLMVLAIRLALGATVLGVADNALGGAVVGTRSVFEAEEKQRYTRIAILRGESILGNTLPNVLPALVGQFRARVLHVVSGAVVVEVVMGIPGLGSLLWEGTLLQDFGVVLAATWAFAVLSAFLLFLQAVFEVLIAIYIRRSPVPAAAAAGAAGGA